MRQKNNSKRSRFLMNFPWCAGRSNVEQDQCAQRSRWVSGGSRCNWSVLAIALGFGFWTAALYAGPAFAWEKGPGYRRAKLSVSPGGKTGFKEVPGSVTGINWTNHLSTRAYTERQNMMNGAGVALGDFDGDGWCDIYLCSKEGDNGLFRNLGNWEFEDVAAAAGVTCAHQSSSGATFADINGDGLLDLLVTSFKGPNACFLNLGGGKFANITDTAGLVSSTGGTSQALGDIDGDGDLDLYVASFGVEAILRDGGAFSTRIVRGKPVVTGRYAKRLAVINDRIVEYGEPDSLYLNDGSGRFTPVEWKDRFRDEDGKTIETPRDFGLAVQIRDMNGDRFPDIYVCNDFQTPDRIWINDGTGHFQAIERIALRNMSYASMGVDFGDLDRDGHMDFFAVEMLSPDHTRRMNQSSPMTAQPRRVGAIHDREEFARNTLCWNRGDSTYEETAFFSGLAASDWSWTPICLDVDLDGYEDILISNGHKHDVNDRDTAEARDRSVPAAGSRNNKTVLDYPNLITPNAAFRNRGNRTFEAVGPQWGFDSLRISHGMATADLDNDGDLDLVVNCLNTPPLVYRNTSSSPRVAVRLRGAAENSQGIGAKVTLRGGPVIQSQEIISGGRYLSGGDPLRTFATGKTNSKLELEVNWRSGARTIISQVLPDSLYELFESEAQQPETVKGTTQGRPNKTELESAIPWFEDVSQAIAHTHSEAGFDDFALQPLLPKKLSQLGPGVAWFDLDGDGDDELIIGTGKGGSVSAFRNDGAGRFSRWGTQVLDRSLPDDSSGLVGWRSGDGQGSLLMALSRYESLSTTEPSVMRYDFAGGVATVGEALPGVFSSPGPLALADLDGDGDLDLFVGGRVIPGRYPEAASSRIFRNTGNRFDLDNENSRVLEGLGLVSGAVFSDLNGDGLPDLAVACEWGDLRVFQNTRGRLREATSEWGLVSEPGLWTSIATGDFDGDGTMDIAAGNWGLNSFYNQAPSGPWHLYYGDLNGTGQIQMLEAYQDPQLNRIVPWRDMQTLESVFPWIREYAPTNQKYGQLGIPEILGDRIKRAKSRRVSNLKSMVFLNRNGGFEGVPLPAPAQWSPVFGLSAGDFDGDGYTDLFLAQNCFSVRTEDHRLDAGRGLWLRGDGKGGFSAIKGQESGIKIYGEQRGCAISDFDRDGRVDLAVAQNGASTKLYRNAKAKPGLRIRLTGPRLNPDAIGARIRLIFGERMGPAIEIHAGAGYWSQDSSTPVAGMPEQPTAVWVGWPGGKISKTPISQPSGEIQIQME